ncbi:MAG: hypothetical protein WCI17_05890 [bacterium]
MKTTVVLPDDLLWRAKQKALEARCTLRTLIENGLRAQVDGPARTATEFRRWPAADFLRRQPK